MKKLYLAVPVEYEQKVLSTIGELGALQLVREIPTEHAEKSETVEVHSKFMRLHDRVNSVSATMTTEELAKHAPAADHEPTLDEIKIFVNEAEPKLDENLSALEKTETESKVLKSAEERLKFLEANGLRVDEIGNFRHIFVKAGLLNYAMIPKLSGYISGTSVVYVEKPGKPKESFVVISGLNEDKPFVEATLRTFNFEEFTFPADLNPEPKAALEEIKKRIEAKDNEVRTLREEVAQMKGKFDALEPYVSNALHVEEARAAVARTEMKSLIHGWIPSDKVDSLKSRVEKVVPKESIYLKVDNPQPDDKVPVQLPTKGILGSFGIFTRLQGVPNYFEINPTPIYMLLYVIMFGMMFGDIGGGSIFIFLGFLLTRAKKGLLVFSKSGTRKLGLIILCCGFSAVIFGALYGELFLMEIIEPILVSPLHDITKIITIALVFGVAQITLALVLNITNMVRRKEPLKAILGGHGIVALTFYMAGISIALSFISQMNFNVFFQSNVLPFTAIALTALALVFLSPLIESRIERKKAKASEKVMEGFGEGLETFISFTANSVSYIRLAAFAIAHGALGLAAVIFATMIGNVPSLILMNVITFLVEGFSAFIQSLRLMYYEFSTKFYAGDGIAYRPLETIKPKA